MNSIRAILKGEKLGGWWFNRTFEFAARRRGETSGLYEYANEETLPFSPLPCWAPLEPRKYRAEVRNLVRLSEQKAAGERQVHESSTSPRSS